jgi:probable F420-dependent oxidoreductase
MADAIGLYAIHFGDHLVMGHRTDRYPYGKFPTGQASPWEEAITVMSAIAAQTEQIRLTSNVLLVPLRPAALLAKSLATLDVLSNGRVEAGVGVGWQKEEYWACGVPWDARYELFERNLRLCRALWAGDPVNVDLGEIRFVHVMSLPRPVQARLPLLYGMRMSEPLAIQIAELGDGWCPYNLPPTQIVTGVQMLRNSFKQHGRDPNALIVRSNVPYVFSSDGRIDVRGTLEGAAPFVEAGVTIVAIGIPPGLETPHEVESFLAEVARVADAL